LVENVAALAHLFLRVWEQLVDDWNGLQDIKHDDRDHDVPHGHHVGWRDGGHDGQVEDQLQGFDHGLDFRERSSDQEVEHHRHQQRAFHRLFYRLTPAVQSFRQFTVRHLLRDLCLKRSEFVVNIRIKRRRIEKVLLLFYVHDYPVLLTQGRDRERVFELKLDEHEVLRVFLHSPGKVEVPQVSVLLKMPVFERLDVEVEDFRVNQS